jgi:hypothetical protein
MGEKSANGCDSEAIFKSGKPSSITFNVGAPTFFWGFAGQSGLRVAARWLKQGALKQFHFADLDCRLGICVVRSVAGDFRRVRFERSLEGLDRLEE